MIAITRASYKPGLLLRNKIPILYKNDLVRQVSLYFEIQNHDIFCNQAQNLRKYKNN